MAAKALFPKTESITLYHLLQSVQETHPSKGWLESIAGTLDKWLGNQLDRTPVHHRADMCIPEVTHNIEGECASSKPSDTRQQCHPLSRHSVGARTNQVGVGGGSGGSVPKLWVSRQSVVIPLGDARLISFRLNG